jgi:hypothetical protein
MPKWAGSGLCLSGLSLSRFFLEVLPPLVAYLGVLSFFSGAATLSGGREMLLWAVPNADGASLPCFGETGFDKFWSALAPCDPIEVTGRPWAF